MLKKISSNQMGMSNLGWLKSQFHFSFAEYYNPKNINFGVLRVINDDLIEANKGFGTHPHKDMEIISYVIDGELSHGDSMGNHGIITRGNVQYMSAGTGVYHSEYNRGQEVLRLLQIWIFPDRRGYQPNYGDFNFDWDLRVNKWLPIVSSHQGEAQVKINQDANISVIQLEKGKEIEFKVASNRQAYLVQIEGTSKINNLELNSRDGLEIIEEDLHIFAVEDSHLLIIEMKKTNERETQGGN